MQLDQQDGGGWLSSPWVGKSTVIFTHLQSASFSQHANTLLVPRGAQPLLAELSLNID